MNSFLKARPQNFLEHVLKMQILGPQGRLMKSQMSGGWALGILCFTRIPDNSNLPSCLETPADMHAEGRI